MCTCARQPHASGHAPCRRGWGRSQQGRGMGADRTELNDLAQTHPEKVKELSAAWEKWGAENYVTPLPRDLGVKYLKVD